MSAVLEDEALARAALAGRARGEASASVTALCLWAEGRAQTIGLDDCVAFAAAAAHAVTGKDVLGNRWRGSWASAAEAEALMPRGLGVEIVRRMRELGWRKQNTSRAVPGDFGLVWVRVAPSAGSASRILLPCVCTGSGWWLARIERGVTHLRSCDVWRCWGHRTEVPHGH